MCQLGYRDERSEAALNSVMQFEVTTTIREPVITGLHTGLDGADEARKYLKPLLVCSNITNRMYNIDISSCNGPSS